MPKLYKSRLWLERQRKAGKSIKEIADECGVSFQIVDRYLKKFRIK